ncbi:MAG TPA: DUF4403 family protein [Saprospiraceae bacterium]|nr:DUF4403 family protein [Saprospiraceae bacterium]
MKILIPQSVRIVFLFIVLFSTLFLHSCSRKSAIPSELPTVADAPQIPVHSDIIFNYRLDRGAIRDTFNRAIDEALEDASGQLEYGIHIDLGKANDAEVIFHEKVVMVTLPVQVLLLRKTFLRDFRASGILELVIITQLNVDSLWNLETRTEIASHKWLNRPKLDAGINIPIERISSWILRRYKAVIEKNIDETVKESISLRNRMINNMKIISEPMEADEALGGWLRVVPEWAWITGTYRTYQWTLGKVYFRVRNEYTSYYPANLTKMWILPPVYVVDELQDTSVIRLSAEVHADDLNRQVNKNLGGKTFRNGNKYITIHHVEIVTKENALIAAAQVSGSFNGMVIISGIPSYDTLNNFIYVRNVDVAVKTKNVIHKAAGWLGKGKIKDALAEMMVFSLDGSIKILQEAIDERITKIRDAYDIDMKMEIGSVTLDDLKMKDHSLIAIFNFKARIEVTVTDFRSFNRMQW